MYNEKKRNTIGVAGWLVCALVINLLALVPMVLRERQQARQTGAALEWDDIMRYGFTIVVGSGLQGVALQYIFGL